MTNITFNGKPLTDDVLRALGCEDTEARDREIRASLRAWLADPANADSPEYSDIFKDVHGFRPRF